MTLPSLGANRRTTIAAMLLLYLFVCSALVAGTPEILHRFTNAATGSQPVGELVPGADGYLYGVTSGQHPVTGGGPSEPGAPELNTSPERGSSVLYRLSPEGEYAAVHTFTGPDGDAATGLSRAADGSLYIVLAEGGLHNGGAIFRFGADGSNGVVVHLQHSTGYGAFWPLLAAQDGHLYGMTSHGGLSGAGTFFRLTPTGDFQVLRHLQPGEVASRLVELEPGSFYGAIHAPGGGSLFRLTAAGEHAFIHSFVEAGGAGTEPLETLLATRDGFVAGVTRRGGAHDAGTLFRWSPAAGLQVLHHFAAGSGGHGNLVESSIGEIYGSFTPAGASSPGVLYRFSVAGGLVEVATLPVSGGTPSAIMQHGERAFYGVIGSVSPFTGDFGTIYRVQAEEEEGWNHFSAYGWSYKLSDGWLWSENYGWLWESKGRCFYWSHSQQAWLWSDGSSAWTWSTRYGWLRGCGGGWCESPAFGYIYLGEDATWAWSPIHGWLTGYGDGRWFYIAAEGWVFAE